MVDVGFSDIMSWIGNIGDWLSKITQKIIVWFATIGVNISTTSAKIINLLLFLIIVYALIKLTSALKKPLKWGIIVLFLFFAISTGISLIN